MMMEFTNGDIGSVKTDKYVLESIIEMARRAAETYEQKLVSTQVYLKHAEEQLEKWKMQNQRVPHVGEFWRYISNGMNVVALITRAPKGEFGAHYSIRYAPNESYTVTTNVRPHTLTEFVAPARENGEFKCGDVVEFWGVQSVVKNVLNFSLLEIGKPESMSHFIVVYADDCKLITPVEMQ